MKKKPLRINIFRFKDNTFTLVIADDKYKGLMRLPPFVHLPESSNFIKHVYAFCTSRDLVVFLLSSALFADSGVLNLFRIGKGGYFFWTMQDNHELYEVEMFLFQ